MPRSRIAPLVGGSLAFFALLSLGGSAVANPDGAEQASDAEAGEAEARDAEARDAEAGEAESSASETGSDVDGEASEGSDRTWATPPPTEWRTSRTRQCHRYRGRAMCDGPLRVPAPRGAPAELAARIGLDDEVRAGRIAMSREPDERWVAAAPTDGETTMLWPVPDGRLWRGFGPQRELRRRAGRVRRGRRRRMHRGVDIGAPAGSLIRAVNDGLVLYSFNSMRGYGNSVVLLHADRTVTLYAHCQATLVFAGQRVRRGQVIAEVGHTGLAHGDHLHFEWRRNGRPRNPIRRFVHMPPRPGQR